MRRIHFVNGYVSSFISICRASSFTHPFVQLKKTAMPDSRDFKSLGEAVTNAVREFLGNSVEPTAQHVIWMVLLVSLSL